MEHICYSCIYIIHYIKIARDNETKKKDFSYAAISIGLAYDTNDMRKLILRAPSRRQSHVTIYVWSTFPYLEHENFANQLSALDSNYTLNHQFHDDH